MCDELFDAEASMEWVKKIDGRMGGIDWDEGCAYIAGASCTRNQFELADRLVMITRNLAKERTALKSRCARLRAALAGVVLKEGPEASIESFDVALATLRQVDDADVMTPWTIKLSQLIFALEVLRETAEEVPHAD